MEWQIGGLYRVERNDCYEVYTFNGRFYEELEVLSTGGMFLCLSLEDTEYFLPRIRVLIAGMTGECFLTLNATIFDWPIDGVSLVKCSNKEG